MPDFKSISMRSGTGQIGQQSMPLKRSLGLIVQGVMAQDDLESSTPRSLFVLLLLQHHPLTHTDPEDSIPMISRELKKWV